MVPAIPLCAGVVELVDTQDSKFSTDFVYQVKIKLFCGVPVKGFAGIIKKGLSADNKCI